LDAPTVAAIWTWFIASANHIHLPLVSTLSMALAVWMLYAGDRLMDGRLLDIDPARYDDLEARHYFHHRHRSAFLIGILLSSIALAALLPRLDAAAIRLYLILGGLVAGYFILIHATSSAAAQRKVARRLPKEIAVGLCFAAATFIPPLPAALICAFLCCPLRSSSRPSAVLTASSSMPGNIKITARNFPLMRSPASLSATFLSSPRRLFSAASLWAYSTTGSSGLFHARAHSRRPSCSCCTIVATPSLEPPFAPPQISP
jgi:hypothetical protein